VQTCPDMSVFGAAGVLWQSGQRQRATTTAAVCQGHVYCRSGGRPRQGSIKHSSHMSSNANFCNSFTYIVVLKRIVNLVLRRNAELSCNHGSASMLCVKSPDVHSIAHVVQAHAFVTGQVYAACFTVCHSALSGCA